MLGRLKRHNAKFRKKIAYHTKRKPVYRRRLQGNKRARTGTGWASTTGTAVGVATAGVRRITTMLRNRKKRSAPVNAMQDLTKSKKSVNMGKYKMSRVVSSLVNHRIERFQSISNFDTNVGAQWLHNVQMPSGAVLSPMYIIDCGSLTQPVIGTGPNVMMRYYWDNLTAAAPILYNGVNGQNPDGGSTGNNSWNLEQSDKATASSFDSAVLNWVNLRMNLYGQRNRTTKFQITVFQTTDEDTDPVTGPSSNPDKRALFQYLERPFIYSNLQQDNSKKKYGFKVIKDFTYNVPAMTTIDLNTVTGNIHEANIHVKINKKMDYIYTSEGAMLPHAVGDGLDYTTTSATTATGLHMNPRPKQNVYIIVRAFAPVRVYAVPVPPQPAETAADCPSFDIIVRRSLSLPPHN